MAEKPKFAENIKRLRKAAGWTQQQVADKISKSKNYVSELEAGNRTNPSTAVQVALAAAFKCEIRDLWGTEDEPDFKTQALRLLERIPEGKQAFALEALEGWASKPGKKTS